MRRVYLDNAATSFPKPEAVYTAIDDYNRRLGAAAGRGAYGSAGDATGLVHRCRMNLARLFHVDDPNRFAFAFNGTDALNIALHGFLRPGDHVVTTVAEHNSVLRPLRALAGRRVTATIVDCDEAGRVSPDAVQAAIRPTTTLVAVTHASNVTGAIQPIAEITELAKAAGACMLVDAAQTAGHLPIDLGNLPVDLLAAPGHKGLLGPLGTGFLYVRSSVEERLAPLRQGGTGTASEDDRHPSRMPERLEAGNLNVAGLAGLEAATRWILDRGVDSLRGHEQELTARLVSGLRSIRGIDIFGPERNEDRTGIVSLFAEAWVTQDLASVLDSEFGIEVRAGLHCAPLIHQRFGTSSRSGLLRLSVGAMTTADDIDLAIASLMALCES